MTINRMIAKFRAKGRHFGGAQEGNTAVVFALAFIPLVGLTGAAVDYSRAAAIQTAMQATADAAVLIVAQNAQSLSAANVQAESDKYYKALFTRTDATNLNVTGTYSNVTVPTVVIGATATYKTSFMNIMGFQTIALAATSTASWGNTRLRVALVLDNTGSMAQSGKMPALQTATNNLLTQLKNAATTSADVYVSIIPFVKDVNLDPVNFNATWIDWTAWNAANSTCVGASGNNANKCTQNGGTWTPKNHNTWNGCVVDRGNATGPNVNDYDANVVTPTTTITATLYSAEQYSSCPQASMGLSNNWAAMTTLVNNMAPAGNTNQAIGLQLGWLSLVGGGPFVVPAFDPNYTYQQVIILLTDGLNTQDRWYTAQASIDARQAIACTNAKNAGIILYMIQVDTDGAPTSTLLQNCASDPSKFFLLKTASEIVTTFNQIGTQLSKLRIAK